MKSNTFNYSLLAVGVAALMGVSAGANAAKPTAIDANPVIINNAASATYKVTGTDAQQSAVSNKVTVTVSEVSSFTLLAVSPEPTSDNNANTNKDLTINPQANQSVTFLHTLKNEGNVTDTYKLAIANVTGDQFDYSGFTTIYTTPTITTATAYDPNVGIVLAPNETAAITIVATSGAKRTVNDNGIITVTASSKYLEGRGGAAVTYEAINTDNAITRTPIYAITKLANTSLNNKIFDAANTNAFIDYTIQIVNTGNADGTAFNVVDALPTGLVALTDTGNTNYVSPKVNGVNTATAATYTNSNKTINFNGLNLAKGQTITVIFRAIKDPNGAAIPTNSNLTNFAVVRDNTLSDTNADNADLVDSSGDKLDTNTTENVYENTATPGTDNNSDATVSTRNQTRNITIGDVNNQEIPLISTNNVYTYTITNAGTDVKEALAAGQVYFTVTPTTAINQITIERVFLDVNNNGLYDDGEKVITPNGTNYDLFDVIGAGGLATGASTKISVQLSSNGTADNSTGGTNNIGAQEVMAITVKAQTVVDGTAAPATAATTSTTTLQGLNLTKAQAVASCTSPGTLTYSTSATPISGQPGQCIYYRLTAVNTFTNTSKTLTSVAITDKLDTSKVTYNPASYNSTATQSYAAPTLIATFATLAAGATGTVDFSATISATGAITP